MHTTLIVPVNEDASLSYRVAIRRNALSLAIARSTTLRCLYARLSNVGCHRSRSATCSLSRSGITASTPRPLSHRRILSELYPLSPAIRPAPAGVRERRAHERPDDRTLVAIAARDDDLQHVAAAVQLAAETTAGQA